MDFSNGCVLPQPPPLAPFLGSQPGQMLQQFPPVLNTLDAQHQQFFPQQVMPQPVFQHCPPPPAAPPPPPVNNQPQIVPPPPQFFHQQPLVGTHPSLSSQIMQQLPASNQFPQQQLMQQSLQPLQGQQPLGHQSQAALPNQFAPQEQSLHQLLGQQPQPPPAPTHISSMPIPPPPETSASSQVSSALQAEAVPVSKPRSPSGHKRGSSQDRRRKSRSHSRGRKKSRSRSRDRRKSRSRSRRRSRSRSKDRRRRSRGRGSRSRGRRRSRSRDRRRSRSRSGKAQGGAHGGLDASTLSESIARAQAAAQQVKASSGSSSWQQGQSAAPEPPKNIAVDWTKIQRSQVQRDFLGASTAFDPAEASRRRQALNITVESDGATPGMTPMPLQSFADLPCIPPWVKQALDENKWETPMPIQAQAFPILLAGRNLIGIAQTGSGKTVAFLLPAVIHANVQQPLRRSDPGPIVLVLAPTRELAVQISEEADKLLRYSSESTGHPRGIRSVAFYGGGKKRDQLQNFTFDGSHIVAATPGRLMDFCGEGKVSLQRVTYFCLDEADRMLELGFLGDMQQIGAAIRPERQMAFFSATWPKEVQSLAMGLCLDSPVTIRVGRQGDGSANADDPEALVANKNITQQVVVVDFPEGKDQWDKQEAEKKRLLDEHIKNALTDQDAKMIIFVNQKNFADELSNQLWNDGIYVDAIHGGRPQEKRLNSLDMFKKGHLRVLIATDVVGRGVDIPHVSHVVIYSMNGVPDYIHRIGRTARGKGTKGHALVFFEYMPKQAQTAKELIEVLEKADQIVPPELRQIQAEVESGKRYDANKDWNYGSGSWKSNTNWQSGSWK